MSSSQRAGGPLCAARALRALPSPLARGRHRGLCRCWRPPRCACALLARSASFGSKSWALRVRSQDRP
eukprot:7878932-Pyramimonas_sp.AAC.1